MSNYVRLGDTGTLDQSFHFRVSPEKAGPPCVYAKGHQIEKQGFPGVQQNCMLDIGQFNEEYDTSQQTAELGCPNLGRFCCAGGFVGRPKRPRFEWGPIYRQPEPDYAGSKQSFVKANGQLPGPYYDPQAIRWTPTCDYSENMRPAVF